MCFYGGDNQKTQHHDFEHKQNKTKPNSKKAASQQPEGFANTDLAKKSAKASFYGEVCLQEQSNGEPLGVKAPEQAQDIDLMLTQNKVVS